MLQLDPRILAFLLQQSSQLPQVPQQPQPMQRDMTAVAQPDQGFEELMQRRDDLQRTLADIEEGKVRKAADPDSDMGVLVTSIFENLTRIFARDELKKIKAALDSPLVEKMFKAKEKE